MKGFTVLLAFLLAMGFGGCDAENGQAPPGDGASAYSDDASAPESGLSEAISPAPSSARAESESAEEGAGAENEEIRVNLSVGEAVFTLRLIDSESTRVLTERMPMTLELSDYASQEKVTALPYDFPAASTERPETIRAGELYLWSGNQLVLFYTTFQNSYGGYVRLGDIEDASGLREALGPGSVTLAFSLAE